MPIEKYVRLRNAAIKNIERLIKNYETSVASSERNQVSAKNSLTKVKKYYKTVEENHELIILACDDSDEHIDIFSEVSDRFEAFQNAVEYYLLEYQKRDDANYVSNLPAQSLPKFDGDPRSWTSFSNTFSSMIGDNKALTGIQRFRYLIGCLEGSAKNTVLHIPETEEAFDVAWTLLRDRYQDKRFIVMNELERLSSLKLKGDDLLTFITEVNEITRKLTMLGEQVEHWNSILLHLVGQKLPSTLMDDFENSLPDDEIPPFGDFIHFIEKRAKTIYKREMTLNFTNQKLKLKQENRFVLKCPQCKFDHTLDKCTNFLKLDTAARWRVTKDSKICTNCLRHSSNVQCLSGGKCRTCGKKHHTLLHAERPNITAHVQEKNSSSVLLATVSVIIETKKSNIKARALLDSGAQLSFITETLAKQIGSPLLNSKRKYKGIGQESRHPLGETNITLKGNGKELHLTPLVIKQLPTTLPEKLLEKQTLFTDLVLADPDYNKPGPIQMVLGMDIYHEILLEERIHHPGELTAQRTIFGWAISGPTPGFMEESAIHFTTWEEEIKSFWDIEAVPKDIVLSEEEKICEELYRKGTTRQKDGRYSVRLPFKTNPPELGHSEGIAIKRLQSLEKKFQRCPKYADQYREVIHDYLNQGHLEPVPFSELRDEANYLPHHAVMKEDSATTKCRVVFDASAKTSNGRSLNEELLNGSKIQQDIFHHLLRFRQHPIAVTADIEKMYRQIRLHPDDRKYQRIVWRDHSRDKIKHYQLTTVTFGLKSAPFLAIRTLHQIAEDYKKQYPIASNILKNHFYVDNLLTGVNSEQEATQCIKQLNEVMKSSGFHLKQWASNTKEIMSNIPEDDKTDAKKWNEIKTLGLVWDTATDTFQYKIQPAPAKQLTKRSLLSIIAGMYDPLGWISPITIKGKILFQHMWTMNLDWDDPLPESIRKQVEEFIESLADLGKLKIPRHAILSGSTKTSLHIFTDASEGAYSAVVYIKSSSNHSNYVQLLTAKTKVAPLKPMTIPKLELTAMVLATRLLKEIRQVWPVDKIFAYSDSKIALAWVQNHPSKWTNFIANRVAQIQETIPTTSWYYVNTTENPADLPTRGCQGHELYQNNRWWMGPQWLATTDVPKDKRNISDAEQETINLSKKREKIQIFQIETEFDLLQKYSSYTKLQRVVAYLFRWRNKNSKSKNLTTDELRKSEQTIIKLAQKPFHHELTQLAKEKPLQSSSSITSLSPFIDAEGILRVGGRLQNSTLQVKHPMLIPKGHIGRLLVEKAHQETFHGGPTTMLAQLRQKYWVIGARQTARAVIHECSTCKRLIGEASHQIMAPLPALRTQPSRPFTTTAIDYAGPINIKTQGIRTTKTFKAYIVVFVCFTTKAVHLDLVTDLSTNAFIAALRRFIGRRGKPHTIYSDNGTNFTGASNELRRLTLMHRNDPEIHNMLASQEIKWQFMPPRAPHMGGLHEAAVKSMKKHLLRVIKDKILNYEELSTILTQIEAILNSRPISPLSSDPNDPEPLTPGHFLIGGPLNSAPDPPLDEFKDHSLSRWETLQKIKQTFWRRWSKEYLSTLQTKNKWTKAKNPVKIGDLVIIKEPNHSPFSWKLGRVNQELQGKDNVTRVVQIKTKDSILTRHITSLIKLELPSERGGRMFAKTADNRSKKLIQSVYENC